MPINSSHKLQEWFLQAWDGVWPSSDVTAISIGQYYVRALGIDQEGFSVLFTKKTKGIILLTQRKEVLAFSSSYKSECHT